MKIQEKRENMGVYDASTRRVDGSVPGTSLSGDYYKDPKIFEREKDAIFYQNWIFAGHVSELSEVGEYKVFTILDESAIIIRSNKDTINAFFNVCRHRGSRVCVETSGSAKRLTCPYHAWSYGIDGTLKSARGMPEDFDKTSNSLHPCPMTIIDGLIFISFADNPPSLAGAINDLREPMQAYDFTNVKVAAHKRYDIPANWKVMLENYQECYHCAPSHPEYALSHTLKAEPEKFDALQNKMIARMEKCGIKHFEVDKQFDVHDEGREQYAYSRYALYEGYQTGSEDGKPLAPLLGSIKGFDHGASDISIGPLTYMLAYNDHVIVYVFTPTGHMTSACDIYWLVRADAKKGKDYTIDRLTWLWDVTTMADKRIVTDNQKGIMSKKYTPGSLSKMEFLLERYITWYLEALQR